MKRVIQRMKARQVDPHSLRFGVSILAAAFILLAGPAGAQELRYSWLDMSLMAQDIDRQGTQIPVPGQTVAVDGSDGSGVRFRGSVDTLSNFYAFFDYSSTDIDVSALVTNAGGQFPAEDEFDFTTIRGGVGFRFPVRTATDVYAEVSYDSADFDFGSFAGENFDTDSQDVGGAVGIRTLLGDTLELRAHARFSNTGDVDLSIGEFDSDTLFGVGFAWELIGGLSIVGDYESGEFSSYSIGFRLDLDED